MVTWWQGTAGERVRRYLVLPRGVACLCYCWASSVAACSRAGVAVWVGKGGVSGMRRQLLVLEHVWWWPGLRATEAEAG